MGYTHNKYIIGTYGCGTATPSTPTPYIYINFLHPQIAIENLFFYIRIKRFSIDYYISIYFIYKYTIYTYKLIACFTLQGHTHTHTHIAHK